MTEPGFKRSPCPVANTLDLLGDRWTLLIVRDLLLRGPRTYGELTKSPERIATNILAERLRRLEEAEIVAKTAYQENPVRFRYSLTPKGEDLRPILLEMVRWANRHIPGTYRPDRIDPAFGTDRQ